MSEDFDEVRTRFIAIITQNPEIRLHDLVGQFPASYADMFTWRKEYFESFAADVDYTPVDSVQLAKAQAQYVNDKALEALAMPNLAITEKEVKSLAKITITEVLEQSLQVAALKLASRITTHCAVPELDSRDFNTLATALSTLNTAFFSKPTQIGIVNNVGGQVFREFNQP